MDLLCEVCDRSIIENENLLYGIDCFKSIK